MDISGLVMKSIVKKPAVDKPLPRGAHRTPPKGYPKEREHYAIPEEWKYPLKPKKRWYAALRYFSKPENFRYYKPAERKRIMARIRRYGKKHYGIDIGEEVKEKFHMKKAKPDKLVRSLQRHLDVLQKSIAEELQEVNSVGPNGNVPRLKGLWFQRTGAQVKAACAKKLKALEAKLKKEKQAIAARKKADPEVGTQSWRLRDIQRDIDRTKTIMGNIDDEQVFLLTEYDLTQLGF